MLFLALKRYGYDIVRVNSQDMQNTYFEGDALLIRKFLNSYTTNDVVYFKYPVKDSLSTSTYFVQRIFGLPGDSLEIRDKTVYLNGMKIQDTATIRHNYFIKAKVAPDSAFMEKYNLIEGGAISEELDYSYSLTFQEYWRLRKDTAIVRVMRKSEKPDAFDETCFPFSQKYKWNRDHYGKIYIPAINDTIPLDTSSLRLYATLIREHEMNKTEVRHDSIFINDRYATSYVIKKNYYFVLGDNRDNAVDSRNWGFLPENLIIGRVIGTIKSNRP